MKNLIIFYLLTLSSCGSANYSIKGFESYVEEFHAQASKYNKAIDLAHLDISFGDTQSAGPEVIGLCYTYESSEDKDIVINKEFWNDATELQRKELMFHEMGHCLLDLDHDDSIVNPPGRPKSIMNSHMIATYWLERFFDDYVKELFSK